MARKSLWKVGLVPGLDNHFNLALTENKRIADGKIIGTGFYNAWATMRLTSEHQHNAFTRQSFSH